MTFSTAEMKSERPDGEREMSLTTAGQVDGPEPWRMEDVRRDSTVENGVDVVYVIRVAVMDVVSFWGGMVMGGDDCVEWLLYSTAGFEMD